MALTLRSNGVAGGLVSAAWWNDYYNLMTGVMTDQPVTFGNNLTVQGSNGIMFNGKLGVSSAGDVIDASTVTTYIKAGTSGSIHFQFPNGTDQFIFSSNTNSGIQVPFELGFRTIGGTKLAEMKNNGNFTIGGTQYQTTAGSISTVSGQTFDAFDVAEVFESDQVYPNGTIVCPGDNNLITQCTHDNCHAAMVVSKNPGLGLGVPDESQNHNYIAMAGRVSVKTASDIQPRQMVVSDGRGGVRPVAYGEPSFVVGIALNKTCEQGDLKGTVGVFLRPIFVILKKPN